MKKSRMLPLLTLVGVLASCGGGGSSDTRRVLKFEFLKAGFGVEVYQKMAEAFMAEHPDVLVKLIPNKEINSTTGPKLQSEKNLSDVYLVKNIRDIRSWAIHGYLYDLSDIYNSPLENDETLKECMDDSAVDFSEYNGHYYSIPEYYNISGFVYNASLFEQNNWAIPKTTHDLELLCKSVKSVVPPIVYCGASADGYLYYMVDGQLTSYEGIVNMKKFYEFGSPEVFAPSASRGKYYGLTNLKKFFFDNGYTMDRCMNKEYIGAQTSLIKGETAMMLNGTWFENEMKDVMDYYPNTKIGMFPVPEVSDEQGNILHSDTYTTEDGKSVLTADVISNYFIPAKAGNLEDAKEFIKFVSRSDICELYTANCNAIRPFKYNLDSTSAVYANMSFFGKSVLEIAKNNTFYVPSSKDSVYLSGKIDLWPQGAAWNYKMYQNPSLYTPDYCLNSDYQYVKTNWDSWHQ